MEVIQYAFKFLIVVFIFIVIIGLLMKLAGYVGEQFGFGKFFMKLWDKVKKKN